MRTCRKVHLKIIMALFFLQFSLNGCDIIIESTCDLPLFEGTYVGNYLVASTIFIDTKDTITIDVDEANNKANFTSVLLDTTVTLNFSDAKKRLNVPTLQVPYVKFDDFELEDVIVQRGSLTLDGSCDRLRINLENITVTRSNIPFNGGSISGATLSSVPDDDFIRLP